VVRVLKKNIIFGILTIVFFVVYWKVLALIWDLWVPFNTTTNVLSMFIVVIVNMPLSAISANQTIKVIKES
jgi:hypothetical protein